MLKLYVILSIICYAEGYQYGYGLPSCPEGYEYKLNACYPKVQCPAGRFLHTDGLCYLSKPLPCPFETTTTTAAPTTTTTTTTTKVPTITTTTTTTTPTPTTTTTEESVFEPIAPPVELVGCPYGSVYVEKRCRKILCTQGEYQAGRCLMPTCPAGTVWRGHSCQPPGYLTTILQIDNVVSNRKTYKVVTENIENVEYSTLPPYNPDTDESYTASVGGPSNLVNWPTSTSTSTSTPTSTTTPTAKPTPRPIWQVDTTSHVDPFPELVPADGCCTVKSPRLCRSYPPKWVCFNRSSNICDRRICKRPIIYLRPPSMQYTANTTMLVMPPNPPLTACQTEDCENNAVLNCSGCAQNLRENCSAGCYNYYCPSRHCQYINVQDYCELYPGGFGCTQKEGCLWNWCGEKRS